ncbi:MAG: GTP-binding protein, partial [Flammeovirgaceae bacterium]
FTFDTGEELTDLSKITQLDTMVTVVDAFNFFKDFGSADTLLDRKLTEDADDTRNIVNLLTDQIEFANVIILNKTDLASAEQLQLLKGLLIKLNPEAKIIESTFGKINPKEILHTNLFDYEKAQQSAGWIKELNNEHTPETEEYGISSFVFRTPVPFHPQRFLNFIQSEWPANVIRSKGIFWLASRPDNAILWSQAGGSTKAEIYGRWWASVPFKQRAQSQAYLQDQDQIQKKWDAQWGDRLNELVIIGQDLHHQNITAALNKCLLNAAEIEAYQKKRDFADDWPL